MPGYQITCPYCFEVFGDEKVHFRMETVFRSEEECDPDGLNRTRAEIDAIGNADLVRQFNLRTRFLERIDGLYKRFWDRFAAINEQPPLFETRNVPNPIMPYNRAVFDPNNENDKECFQDAPIAINGFVSSIVDCFGRETERRVCPACHNPLPNSYGRHNIKFISIIGVTSAGKTVYLSQLCSKLARAAANLGMTAIPISQSAMDFIQKYPVKMDTPLPEGTTPREFTQPIFYNLSNNGQTITIVIYDIAGENCVEANAMAIFGRFISRSNGIVLLIDPGEFEKAAGNAGGVINAIYNYLIAGGNGKCGIPMAVSISKGDTGIFNQIIGDDSNLEDVTYIEDPITGLGMPLFNALDYNLLQPYLKIYIDDNANPLRIALMNHFDTYNYFILSSIGVGLTQDNAPAESPISKRVDEPILWLLHKMGYIGSNGDIKPPEIENVAEAIDGGRWTCAKGHSGNTGERCAICNRDKEGNKSGISSFFKKLFKNSFEEERE